MNDLGPLEQIKPFVPTFAIYRCREEALVKRAREIEERNLGSFSRLGGSGTYISPTFDHTDARSENGIARVLAAIGASSSISDRRSSSIT